ncbi:hypothetical protein ACHAWO_009968 [Cyclotella atomus]|uniref:Prolyl 4-hydroxylase alpha subunit Fe(2+) 2OG dioxygenase domain-containing protein n=1 Tax=Cyclotella atomus TaxID=382360 RepID=A0ABD3QII3_9STRA
MTSGQTSARRVQLPSLSSLCITFQAKNTQSHHDFGYDRMSSVHQPSRSINVLLYLNDVEEGGETSFPRWFNAETTGGLDVKPEKGKAVLFYMLLPDGNSDDLSQHAALPVIKGEKMDVKPLDLGSVQGLKHQACREGPTTCTLIPS